MDSTRAPVVAQIQVAGRPICLERMRKVKL